MQHAANLKTSTLLQGIYDVLTDYQWHTTKEIADRTGCEVTSTRISEIRRNNIKIDCEYVGQTDKGNKIYRYRMLIF